MRLAACLNWSVALVVLLTGCHADPMMDIRHGKRIKLERPPGVVGRLVSVDEQLHYATTRAGRLFKACFDDSNRGTSLVDHRQYSIDLRVNVARDNADGEDGNHHTVVFLAQIRLYPDARPSGDFIVPRVFSEIVRREGRIDWLEWEYDEVFRKLVREVTGILASIESIPDDPADAQRLRGDALEGRSAGHGAGVCGEGASPGEE